MIFNVSSRLYVERDGGKVFVWVRADEGWVRAELSKRQSRLVCEALADKPEGT